MSKEIVFLVVLGIAWIMVPTKPPKTRILACIGLLALAGCSHGVTLDPVGDTLRSQGLHPIDVESISTGNGTVAVLCGSSANAYAFLADYPAKPYQPIVGVVCSGNDGARIILRSAG